MDYYNKNAEALAEQYNSLNPETVHAAWCHHISSIKGRVCDIGAGSGRDSNWLASNGWRVVAVEPCSALLEQAQGNSHVNVSWLSDSLPELNKLQLFHQCFDLILVSAVWMHLTQDAQKEALFVLKSLLSDNGLLVITWRNQANDTQRQFETVDESLFCTAEIISSEDKIGREGVTWKTVVIKKELRLSPLIKTT